jgi:hypothetical protein
MNLQKNTPASFLFEEDRGTLKDQNVQKRQNRQGKNMTFPGGSV